jgi:hypothetical protein
MPWPVIGTPAKICALAALAVASPASGQEILRPPGSKGAPIVCDVYAKDAAGKETASCARCKPGFLLRNRECLPVGDFGAARKSRPSPPPSDNGIRGIQ